MSETEQDREPLTRTERVRQWSQTKHERKRVTPEDLIARSARRAAEREERAAAKPQRPAGVLWRRIAATVMALVAVGLIFTERGAALAHQERLNQLQVQTNELVAQSADAAEELRGLEIDPEAVAVALERAEVKAVEVAELQNQYHFNQVSTQLDANGIAEVVGGEEYQEIHDGLEELFTREAQDSGGLDPATQWFLMWDETSPNVWELAPGEAYQWEAPQVWTVVDSHTVRVVWVLRETSTGDILAWATGHYEAGSDAFGKVVLGTTSRGDSRIAPTDSDIAGDSDQHEPASPAAPTEDEEGER